MLGWLPEDVSPYGAGIDALFYFIYYLTAAAFIIVTALMLIFLYVYRDQGGRRAAYTHGNTAMEIIWTIIPAIIFISLGLVSRSLWEEIKLAPPETDTVVKVTGKQFNWEILYPGPDGEFDTADDKQIDNDIRVPAGKPVRVILASKDVIHSFFMPNLRFKQDMVPGREITGWFQANKPGRYEIPCAELCGFGHSGMKGWLYALAPEEYQAWRDEQWPQTASSNGTPATEQTETAATQESAPAETVTAEGEPEGAGGGGVAAGAAAVAVGAAALGETSEAGQAVAETARDAATEASEAATEATEASEAAVSAAQEAVSDTAEAAPDTAETSTDAAATASDTQDAATEAAAEASDTATEAVAEAQDTAETATEAMDSATEAIQSTNGAAEKATEDVAEEATEAAAEAAESATEAVQDAAGTVQETSDAAQTASEGAQGAAEAAKEATDAAAEAVEGAAEDTTSAVQETSDAAQGAAEGIADSTTETAQDALQGASSAFQEEAEQAGVATVAATSGAASAVAAASAIADSAAQMPETEMPKTQSAQETSAEQSSPEATPEASGQDSSADVSSRQYAFTPTAAGQSDQGEPCKGQLEILSGATIYDIAGAFYAEAKRFLGVDLIRDYNTHIKNLDNIYPGQKLCIPTLAQTTRLRQEQESGSFNLILDAFRSSRKAKALARSVQQKGYQAVVIPRQVSHSLLLQRVEITGLQDQTTASQAWKLFSGDDDLS